MGKQLIFDALQGKQTERTPWLPFVGCHGGKLIGKDANEYLRSGELIAQGIREAIAQYRPDGIPVMFDLQIEAEALGCDLQWAKDNPPARGGACTRKTEAGRPAHSGRLLGSHPGNVASHSPAHKR